MKEVLARMFSVKKWKTLASIGSNNKDIYYFIKTLKMDQLQAQHDQGV